MRARNIKPGFFLNELLAQTSPHCRLFFLGLVCVSDREGRCKCIASRLKGQIFPYEPHVKIQKYIDKLQELGFINVYEVKGSKYIQVVNFKKHQSPHHTEKPSDIPPQNNGELTVNSPLSNGEYPLRHGENPPDSLIPDSLNHERGLIDSQEEPPPSFGSIKIQLTPSESFEVPENEYDNLTMHTGSQQLAEEYFRRVKLHEKSVGTKYMSLLHTAITWYERDVRENKVTKPVQKTQAKNKLKTCSHCGFDFGRFDFPEGSDICLDCTNKLHPVLEIPKI